MGEGKCSGCGQQVHLQTQGHHPLSALRHRLCLANANWHLPMQKGNAHLRLPKSAPSASAPPAGSTDFGHSLTMFSSLSQRKRWLAL